MSYENDNNYSPAPFLSLYEEVVKVFLVFQHELLPQNEPCMFVADARFISCQVGVLRANIILSFWFASFRINIVFLFILFWQQFSSI